MENEYLDSMLNRNIAKYLRERRIEKKITLQEIANYAGTSKQNIFKYEKGESKIRIKYFDMICSFLGDIPKEAYNYILVKTYEEGYKGE